MPVQLPIVPAIANYSVGTTFDGVAYTLGVRWNTRDAAWYLDLYNDEGELLRAGMRIVLGVPIGIRSASDEVPPGMIIASDLSNSGREATFDDLGTRVALYYYSPGEEP